MDSKQNKNEEIPKADYPPDVRVVEKKVKTIEGYNTSLVRSLAEDK